MNRMVDIELIADESRDDPKVVIYARQKNEQVEGIIHAIETAGESAFPMISGYRDDKLEILSQRDIIRIYTHGRKLMLQTSEATYSIGRTLSAIEELLNNDRFIRISQSEIINLYKVKCFEFSNAGTIGIEFENGERSFASRSRVKALKELLKKYR